MSTASQRTFQPTFYYDNPYATLSERLVRPNLSYSAPELVAGSQTQSMETSGACDVFSLGCVMYEVLTRRRLLTSLDTAEYRGVLASMSLVSFDKVPANLLVRRPHSPQSVTSFTPVCDLVLASMSLVSFDKFDKVPANLLVRRPSMLRDP